MSNVLASRCLTRDCCTLSAVAAVCALHPVWAQTAPATTTAQTVVVTGNPLQRAESAQAASVLAGDGLVLRRGATLGETLDGLPGVASTAFGPNASRPVIRGLDGDRIRLLDNGGASIDASSLSFDHAVALDALVVERIEVLRGPAALLYGGNATGGVVNTLDNRIPRVRASGLSGRADFRQGGAADERSAAAVLEGGAGDLAWHADAFTRRTQDLRVPAYRPVEDGTALPVATRVRNSAAQGKGGAIGASWIGQDGFVGLSADTWRSRYGVTVEPDVSIDMERRRVAAAGEWRDLAGPLRQVSFNAVHTDYTHAEIEGSGDIGTTFDSRGSDIRLEARHAPLGPFSGVLGMQLEALRFSALGAEAFVPATRTRSSALFLLEEWRRGALSVTAGARTEQVSVRSAGDAADAAEPRFGDAQTRRFSPRSASVAMSWAPATAWRVDASLGRTQRAPAYYELFANGVHVATAAVEIGDATLAEESGRQAELGLSWADGPIGWKARVYSNRFSHFISLEATGDTVDLPGEDGGIESFPVYRFRSVRARLQGLELEGRWRWQQGRWTVDLTGSLDGVRADNLDTGEPLSRIAPRRVQVGLEAAQGPWRFGAGLQQAARQNRVPTGDSATPGWTRGQLWATWRGRWNDLSLLAYARLDNVGDTLAYNASTIATMRGLAPMPRRAMSAGLRADF